MTTVRRVCATCALVLAAFVLLEGQTTSQYPPLLFRDEGSDIGRATRAVNCTGTGITCTASGGVVTVNAAGGGGAPTTATYITQTADAGLSAEQALSALGTGILKNTTGTGVLSIAVAGDFPTLNQNTTGTAAGLSATLAVASGGTNLTAAADDNVMVGNGTTWQTKTVPDCDTAATSKLLYDQTTNAFSCGTDQTGGGSGDTVLTLGADVSTAANTTPVNITGISFSATANTRFKVEIWSIHQSAAATTGFGIGVNCTSAPQLVSMTGSTQLANTGTGTQWSAIANNAIVGVTSGLPSAATNVANHGGGTIYANAATTNTCQFLLRSETTAVTTIKAGSVFIVRAL